MIELVRDLRVINVLAKFENDPWKIMDMRVLTGLVCPAARPPARPLGVRQYSETTWAVGIAQLTHHEVQGGGKNPSTSGLGIFALTADRVVS